MDSILDLLSFFIVFTHDRCVLCDACFLVRSGCCQGSMSYVLASAMCFACCCCGCGCGCGGCLLVVCCGCLLWLLMLLLLLWWWWWWFQWGSDSVGWRFVLVSPSVFRSYPLLFGSFKFGSIAFLALFYILPFDTCSICSLLLVSVVWQHL